MARFHICLSASAFLSVVMLTGSAPCMLTAATIISVRGVPSSGGLVVESGVQELATSWSSSESYSDVAITANLYGSAGTAYVRAYLMTGIGPGTTVNQQIAFSTIPVLNIGNYTLFSDLSLPAGSYYLVLSTVMPFPSAVWRFVVSDEVITTDPSTTFTGYFDACGASPCDVYPPAGTFRGPDFGQPLIFDVSGTPVPEPAMTLTLVVAAFVVAVGKIHRKRL
jgi:hypothetical protein